MSTIVEHRSMPQWPDLCSVAAGKLNGWQCQRIRSTNGTRYYIERADGKLHEAPEIIHAKIDAAIDGIGSVEGGRDA